jgi:AcrR family transcriptional regulator
VNRRYHFIDQVNGQVDQVSSEPRRRTRAEQRAATRLALLDATTELLLEEGYSGLSTRRVAERAGVAQSTLMHYFPTREDFLIEAITHLALRLADDALEGIDLAAMRRPEHRERVLDQAWREFTSREALAAGQLWMAAWAEPELAATLRGLEQRLNSIIMLTASTLFPDLASDSKFPALLDGVIAIIRGLVIEIPIWGHEAVTARWEALKPIILDAAAQLLD